jgi:hypothetical protein
VGTVADQVDISVLTTGDPQTGNSVTVVRHCRAGIARLRWIGVRRYGPERGPAIQPGEEAGMVRLYAKVVGVTVILIGLVGLVLGDTSLFGVLNIDLAEDGIHLLTGGLLAYAGFAARDMRLVRAIVGGTGIAYLAVGLVAFASPMLFGLIPSGYEVVLDNLIHLTLGVLGIYVGFFAERQQEQAGSPARS